MKTRRRPRKPRMPKVDWRKAVALLAGRDSLFSGHAISTRTQAGEAAGPQQTGKTSGGDR